MASQPLRQHRPRPRQPSRKRAIRHADLTSSLLAGLPLQVAEDDGDTILVGQAAQLLVEQRLQVVPEVLFGHGGFWHLRHLPLSGPPFGGCCSRLQRRLVGHTVKPVGDHLPRYDRCRLPDEDEEGGLEGVFGVVVIAEDTATHAPDHRTMPMYEGCKSRFFVPADVVLQQLPIGQPRPIAQQHRPAKVRDDLADLVDRHVVSLVRATPALYRTITRTESFDAFFWLRAGGPLQQTRTSSKPRQSSKPSGNSSKSCGSRSKPH